MVILLYVVVLLLLAFCSSLTAASMTQQQYNTILKYVGPEAMSSTSLNASKSSGIEFPCNVSQKKASPTSVHKLRPEDIDIVAAMGDSITAALGAKSTSLLNIMTEFRGVSWSIGGDESVNTLITLPNILKKFNPNLIGFSTGSGGPSSKEAALNMAISGAIGKNMPEQARTLISKMKADPKVDFENSWKVVSMWIGGNDLCAICKRNEENQPLEYAKYMEEALDILYAEMPRVFINVVLILDVSRLYKVQDGLCTFLHKIVCSCATKPKKEERDIVSEAALKFQELTNQIVEKPKYTKRTDFATVVQPFFEYTDIPENEGTPERDYLAPDCFHFSIKAHEAAALALWNNIVEPVGLKRNMWYPGENLQCPTVENPYLLTSENSKVSSIEFVSSRNPMIKSTSSLSIGISICIGILALCVAFSVAGVLIRYHYRSSEDNVPLNEATPILVSPQ